MAIENIQCVYDHIRLYSRTAKLVINQFFIRLQEEQQIETTKIQLKLSNAVEPAKPYLAPQNIVNRAFLEPQKCGICFLLKKNI